MWEIVRAGGPLMWPIILCSITAAAIILERLWTLQDNRVLPRELPQRVWQLIETNQVNDKVIAALEQNSPLGRLLAQASDKVRVLAGTGRHFGPWKQCGAGAILPCTVSRPLEFSCSTYEARCMMNTESPASSVRPSAMDSTSITVFVPRI